MWLGGLLTFWIGPTVPLPASPVLLENLEQAQITHNDSGRSGFQLTFRVGRDRKAGLLDFPPLLMQLVKAGHRVLLVATLQGRPQVLMDGIITNLQLSPGSEPGTSRLSVTGEDVSVMMDLHEMRSSYPCMADWMIAGSILARYAVYGIVPRITLPSDDSSPSPSEQTPTRNGTDLGVLKQMAGQRGYVFYVDAGPVPGMNQAYWGPPVRSGVPQRALTFGMGAATNVGSIQMQSDANQPKLVYGLIQESSSGFPVPVVGVPTGQPLSALPALIGNMPFVGSKQLGDDCGGDVARAYATASSEVNRSVQGALTASGELDVARYGDVLKARALVAVRGVGLSFDGTWYVKSVSHTITPGAYKQSFNLEREGTLPLSPMVRV